MQEIALWDELVAFIRNLLPPVLQNYAAVIAAIPFFILLYILYLVAIRSVKSSLGRIGVPREATSSIVFIIRLIFFGIVVAVILSITRIFRLEGVIAASTLIGTAVGLAFSRSLSNLVSGIYVLATRPFRVGDYIKIGDTEGLVQEITLNYTRLLTPDFTRRGVPNSSVVDSDVTNYRVRVDDLTDLLGIEYDEQELSSSRLDSLRQKFKYLTTGEEVYRYTFDIYQHLSYSNTKVKDAFTALCDKWADKFLMKPEFFYWSSQNFGMVYRFAIVVKNARNILFEGADFMTEAAETLHQVQ
ncbi:MAG: mechanosensitive ion channel family protein [Candidatus Thorarchaeota archaeon]|nr:mechanosensitive ion channel family protein [Candidatus Thorarchaeota archaeon]